MLNTSLTKWTETITSLKSHPIKSITKHQYYAQHSTARMKRNSEGVKLVCQDVLPDSILEGS